MASLMQPGAGESVTIGANEVLFKVVDGDGCSGFSLIEQTVAPGTPGPVLHRHDFDEAFWVLEGELTIDLGDRTENLGAGGFAFIPGGDAHSFRNETDQTVRMLLLCSPAGFEAYFRDLAELVARGPDPRSMGELAARYGVRPVE